MIQLSYNIQIDTKYDDNFATILSSHFLTNVTQKLEVFSLLTAKNEFLLQLPLHEKLTPQMVNPFVYVPHKLTAKFYVYKL